MEKPNYKIILRSTLLLLSPFIIMIFTNEITRPSIKEKPNVVFGVSAINSSDKLLNKCTWNCHNQTFYCKENHVKYLKSSFRFTDRIYFGAIEIMALTGNYGAANIIILVVLIPLWIWFFLFKSLNIQFEIKRLNKRR